MSDVRNLLKLFSNKSNIFRVKVFLSNQNALFYTYAYLAKSYDVQNRLSWFGHKKGGNNYPIYE